MPDEPRRQRVDEVEVQAPAEQAPPDIGHQQQVANRMRELNDATNSALEQLKTMPLNPNARAALQQQIQGNVTEQQVLASRVQGSAPVMTPTTNVTGVTENVKQPGFFGKMLGGLGAPGNALANVLQIDTEPKIIETTHMETTDVSGIQAAAQNASSQAVSAADAASQKQAEIDLALEQAVAGGDQGTAEYLMGQRDQAVSDAKAAKPVEEAKAGRQVDADKIKEATQQLQSPKAGDADTAQGLKDAAHNLSQVEADGAVVVETDTLSLDGDESSSIVNDMVSGARADMRSGEIQKAAGTLGIAAGKIDTGKVARASAENLAEQAASSAAAGDSVTAETLANQAGEVLDAAGVDSASLASQSPNLRLVDGIEEGDITELQEHALVNQFQAEGFSPDEARKEVSQFEDTAVQLAEHVVAETPEYSQLKPTDITQAALNLADPSNTQTAEHEIIGHLNQALDSNHRQLLLDEAKRLAEQRIEREIDVSHAINPGVDDLAKAA